MNVTLYKTSDDINVMNKTLTPITNPIACAPTIACNTETPSIILTYNSAYLNCNYAYIDTFNKYYFVAPPTVQSGQRIKLDLTVDALYTYRESIKNCKGLAVRSESEGKPTAIVDNMLPINPNKEDVLSILFDKQPFIHDQLSTQTARCWYLQTM